MRTFLSLLPPFPKSAGSAKELRDWELELRKRYPIRYKINELVKTVWQTCILFPSWRLRDAKYWVLHRVHPKYIYHKFTFKTLEPGYCDCRERILHANFDLFTEFMEFQLSDKCYVSWDYSDEDLDEDGSDSYRQQRQECWDTMNELYDWWTMVRPSRQLSPDLPDLPDDWGFLAPFNDDFRDTPEVMEWRKVAVEHHKQEEDWDKEDEVMLIKLMKIRLSLWD